MNFWARLALTALILLGCGCGEMKQYLEPPSTEPMGINYWWGSDPTCSPGCPPGATTGW